MAAEVSVEQGAVRAAPRHLSSVPTVRVQTHGRLVQLDLLRGYFVLMLAAIHLDYLPSLFGSFDGRGALWFSEAEGFFFISGLLAAMLRRRDLEKGGLGLVTQRSWRRARQLYVLACALTILYSAIGRLAEARAWPGVMVGLDSTSSWLQVVTNTLTFRYVYGWGDFLTMYVPMFLALPLLVWSLRKKWDVAVVAASLAVYASLTWHSFGVADGYLQWQVDFVIGAVVGFRFNEIRTWLGGLTERTRRVLASSAVLAATATYAAGTAWLDHPWWYNNRTAALLLANNRLGLLRPLLCVVMVAGGYVLLTWLRRPLMATVGPVLELFGRNSLYVYVCQSMFVFVIPFVIPDRAGLHGFVDNTALDLSIVAIIWLGLRTNFLTRYVPR